MQISFVNSGGIERNLEKMRHEKKFPLGSGVCCCYANIFICQKHDEIQLIKQVET